MGAHEIDLCFHNFFPEGKYFFPGQKDYLAIPNIPDGISTHAINSATSGNIYDLTGRRIQQVPMKGLYVDGGKVKVAK